MSRDRRGSGLRALALAASVGLSASSSAFGAELTPAGRSTVLGTTVARGTTTLTAALVQAYQNNPQLNAERARQRATDENVPQALSGYRPTVSATADVGVQYVDTQSTTGNVTGTSVPRGFGAT